MLAFLHVVGLAAWLSATTAEAAIGPLKALGPDASGQPAAAAAWTQLAARSPRELPAILAALDGAEPLAANWIRTAVDAIAERADALNPLPLKELEAFVRDRRHSPRARRLAYELLLSVDETAESRIIPGSLDDPSLELRRDAVAAVIAAAQTEEQGGRSAEAAKLYRRAFDAARDLDQVRDAAARLKRLGQTTSLAEHFGYVRQWHVVGPFDNTDEKGYAAVYPLEQNLDLAATYDGKHAPVGWRPFSTADEMGVVDFNKALAEEKAVVAYAATDFSVREPAEVEFRLSTFNAAKLWLNGRLLGQWAAYHSGSQFDQYTVRGRLKPGANRILVKVCQNAQTQEWAKVWQFQLRVCDATGGAIRPDARPADAAAGRSTAARPVPPLAMAAWLLSAAVVADWPEFRGRQGQGRGAEPAPQVAASDAIAWTAALPGKGPSSPIVVGGRVFVTAASGARSDRLHLLAFDVASGQRRWQRQLWATGSTIHNPFGGVAAATPASDGRRVVALYSSSDLACFDLEGRLLWCRGLGMETPALRNDVGMAASPAIVGDAVVVQCESQGASFVEAIDLATGRTRWKKPRGNETSWCSPVALPHPRGPAAVLVQSRSRLTAYAAADGAELADLERENHTVASPLADADRVYVPADGLQCLSVDRAAGRFEVLWKESRLKLGNASPALADGRLYLIKGSVLVCAAADTGATLWQLRLKGSFWATPVVAGKRLYAVNHDGLLHVVALETPGKLVETLQLGRGVLASPAVAAGALFLRNNESLWRLGK